MNDIPKGSKKSANEQQDIINADNKRPAEIVKAMQQLSRRMFVKPRPEPVNLPKRAERLGQDELKELLRGQLTEVMTGCGEFAEALGEPEVSREDFERTLEYKFAQWAVDGSMDYLQDYLAEHPAKFGKPEYGMDRNDPKLRIYLSAAPNKIIPREKIFAAAKAFGESQGGETLIDDHLLDSRIVDDAFCDKPEKDVNGEILPVSLTVWTNFPNMESGKTVPELREELAGIQRTVGSAIDPSPLQCVGEWYRLRQSQDFTGVGKLQGIYVPSATIARRFTVDWQNDTHDNEDSPSISCQVSNREDRAEIKEIVRPVVYRHARFIIR